MRDTMADPMRMTTVNSETFVSGPDGSFKHLKKLELDKHSALTGAMCNITIKFTCLTIQTPRTVPETTILAGGIVENIPPRWDNAPGDMTNSWKGEDALVRLWRRLRGNYSEWKSLKMECVTDAGPKYTLSLTVHDVMEDLSLTVHESDVRLTVDLSRAFALQQLKLHGAFNLFPGDHILANLVKLDVAGNELEGTGVLLSSSTPEFLFAILQLAPNIQEVKASMVTSTRDSQRRYRPISLPHLHSLEIGFVSCDAGVVATVMEAILPGPTLTMLDVKFCSTQPDEGGRSIASLLRRAQASLTKFTVSARPEQFPFDMPMLSDVLRICPRLETLLLTANLLAPTFLADFAKSSDTCPSLDTVMFIGSPSCSLQRLLEVLAVRRDTLNRIVCPRMDSEEIGAYLGTTIEVKDFDPAHVVVRLYDEDDSEEE